MKKIIKGALIIAVILTLNAKTLQAEEVSPPQKAAEGQKINPKLWYRLLFQDARADLFTHWERVHPHRTLSAAKTPRVYKRNTQSVDAVTYELDGQRYPLSHYIEKADISGLMVLYGGEVRLEYYGKGLDAQSRNHIWSATKSFTSTLVGMALFEGKISSLGDTAEQYAPQFKGTAYGETSVRHLLMMSSGIDYFHFKGSPNRNDMYNDLIQKGGDFDKWLLHYRGAFQAVPISIISLLTRMSWPRFCGAPTESLLSKSCRKNSGSPSALAKRNGGWMHTDMLRDISRCRSRCKTSLTLGSFTSKI